MLIVLSFSVVDQCHPAILGIPMMRNIFLLVSAILLFGTIHSGSRAQEPYSLVYDLYYAIMESPESGNELIANITNRFDDRFYECLGELSERWSVYAQNHYQYCDRVHGDPNRRANCNQQNEPAKFHHWLRTIRVVTRGEMRWSDTIIAQAAVMGKRIVPQMYIQAHRSIIPSYRPDLLCQ